jgi:hypothetical protein
VAAGYEIRVSDTEREAAAAELREHFASGRLNQDELNERLDQVFAAKTRGDLNAPFTDLPSSGNGWAGAGASGGGASGGGRTFGTGGAFGSGGAFGPAGTRAGGWGPWGQPGVGDGRSQWEARSCGWRSEARHAVGTFVLSGVLLSALLLFGILGAFGIGTGRPIGIVLIIAAFALLRRLLFVIFGRRRTRGGRGGRGPRRRR